MTKSFEQLRVVELAGSHAGAFAAKVFADHGARVVKIVPPGGDPLLHHGELLPSHAFGDGEVGSIWAYCNTSKQVVEAELDSTDVRALILDARRRDRELRARTAGSPDSWCCGSEASQGVSVAVLDCMGRGLSATRMSSPTMQPAGTCISMANPTDIRSGGSVGIRSTRLACTASSVRWRR